MIAKFGSFEYALAERYRFEDELGRGAMGTVYRAKDVRLGRPVAIKMLHPALTNELGVARFQSEIRIAAGLHHPNIVGVHEAGEADGRLFYVMDYLGGETLRDRLRREKQLSVEDAIRIAEQVAQGLQYAHDHDVVHRDVKPENIILAEGRASVVDFGLARALGDVDAQRLTASGLSVGTPHYLSPEQASAERDVGPPADQYALACVLYEMLVGEPPFTGPTASAVAMRHISEAPPPLRKRRKTTSIGLDAAVMRALEKVPADRFDSMSGFVRQLRSPLDLAPVPTSSRGSRSAFLAIALVALVAAVWLFPWSRRLGGSVNPEPDQLAPASSAEKLRRIAVLYFDDNSADHRLRYLADGLTESVIDQLSSVPGLAVVSRNGVKQFRDTALSFDAMVQRLGVGSVVEGSLRESRDSIYVTVRLIAGESGLAVAGTTIARAANDILSMHDEIGHQVSLFLRQRLGEQVRLRSVGVGTPSGKALDLLLRAERIRKDAVAVAEHPDSGGRRQAIAQLLRRGDDLLVAAEKEDARWVQPTVARGWLALQSASIARNDGARLAMLERAHEHARRAFARDSLNASVLELLGTAEWSLATVAYTAKMDRRLVDAAREHLRAAVSIDSTLASAWATLSTLLRFSGGTAERREADLYARRALDADAYLTNAGTILNGLFRSALHLGDTASARAWCARGKRSTDRDPKFVECDLTLMVYGYAKADPVRAWSIVEELAALDPPDRGFPYNPVHRRMLAAIVSAVAGDHDRAKMELTSARAAVVTDSGLAIDLLLDESVLWRAMGANDSAAAKLEKYIAARGYRQFLSSDPLYAPIISAAMPGTLRR